MVNSSLIHRFTVFPVCFFLSVQVFFKEDERTTTRESHSDPQWDNESLDANAEPCPLLVLTALWLWRRGFTHVLGGMLVSKTLTNIDLLYVRVLMTMALLFSISLHPHTLKTICVNFRSIFSAKRADRPTLIKLISTTLRKGKEAESRQIRVINLPQLTPLYSA